MKNAKIRKMDIIKKGISKVKDNVNKEILTKRLNEATSNELCTANVAVLNEISSRTDIREETKIIIKYCIKVLQLKPKFWKRILKTLKLIEHCLKTGSSNFVENMKDERDRIKDLFEFSYMDDGKDKGETSK